MHRISERVFQAKKDLEKCEGKIRGLEAAIKALQGCLLPWTLDAVKAELEYWKLRAESAKAMIAVETVGEW